MGIEVVPVRATVSFGGVDIKTPHVLSFSVKKSRSQPSTFDVNLKVLNDVINGSLTGGPITIFAGVKGAEHKIFTGVVTQAKIEPCNEDPSYVILNMSGRDILMLLEGKKYIRRCRATKGMFCVINDVTRNGLKSGKFAYTNLNALTLDTGEHKDYGKTGTIPIPYESAKASASGFKPVADLRTEIIGGSE